MEQNTIFSFIKYLQVFTVIIGVHALYLLQPKTLYSYTHNAHYNLRCWVGVLYFFILGLLDNEIWIQKDNSPPPLSPNPNPPFNFSVVQSNSQDSLRILFNKHFAKTCIEIISNALSRPNFLPYHNTAVFFNLLNRF